MVAAYFVYSFGARARIGEIVFGRNKTGHAAARPANKIATKRSDNLSDPYADFRNVSYSNEGLFSEKDEIQLGAKLHAEILKKFKITSVGQSRLSRIGKSVALTSRRPRLLYRFFVVEDREINAFSGPGGYVYMTTAIMKLANDDELAAVLAHEIGHVVGRHSLKSIQQSEQMSSLADWFGSVTGIAGKTAENLGKAAANIVGNGLLAVHTREEEREADFLGVRCAKQAGYDPEGMISMFRKLQQLSKDNAGVLGSLFSDHPDVEERIENTHYEIELMKHSGASSMSGTQKLKVESAFR